MAVSIAEYLGQRTDNDSVQILPLHDRKYDNKDELPRCPFHGKHCKKIAMEQFSKAPVCSVRRTSGQYYIVCEHRLISTIDEELNEYRSAMLLRAAKVLFHPDIQAHQVLYKREQDVLVAQQTAVDEESVDVAHSADFILSVRDASIPVMGPRTLIVEVQGGGETSSTGAISRWANEWAQTKRNNAYLRSKIPKPGTIQTNAWRRLQEQILGKGSTAAKSNCGFAVLMGDVVADYIERIMPAIRSQRLDPRKQAWNVAFVVFKEVKPVGGTPPRELVKGAVELEVDPVRTIYTTMAQLVDSIRSRGVELPSPNIFDSGVFKTIEYRPVDNA